jgi:hypothetical protein
MPKMLDLSRSLKTAWNPSVVEKLVADVLVRRDAMPHRHHDQDLFSKLIQAEEQIDFAFLSQDMAGLRSAINQWFTIADACQTERCRESDVCNEDVLLTTGNEAA